MSSIPWGLASLITRTTNDVMQLQQLVVMGMRMMMMAPIMCIWGIIKAIQSAPQLTWILAVIIAALLVVVWIVASKTIPVFQILQKKLDRLNLVMREKLTGIRVIRAFNKQSYEKKRFDESNQDLTDTAVRVNRTVAILMPAVMIGMNLATVAIMWFGSKGIDAMGLELGTLMAFVQYAMQVMFAIIACAMIFVMLPRALASAKRVNEVLDVATEIKDPDVKSDAEMKRGFVEFKNVSFQYPGAEEPTLRDISFRTEPGQVTAIIGGTGSGKSTILNLILRFYDVTQGQVSVNGVDVRQLSQRMSPRPDFLCAAETNPFFRDSLRQYPQRAVGRNGGGDPPCGRCGTGRWLYLRDGKRLCISHSTRGDQCFWRPAPASGRCPGPCPKSAGVSVRRYVFSPRF